MLPPCCFCILHTTKAWEKRSPFVFDVGSVIGWLVSCLTRLEMYMKGLHAYFDHWRWNHHVVSNHRAPVIQWCSITFQKNRDNCSGANPPKACNIREVKYFCTCVAKHSFRVLCFYVNVTCILETDMAARFVAGNWKRKCEVVHGVLQFESGCLVL
jgi:hypothetical protein